MYCVGVTGNIASGKSTVMAYFKTLKIAVIIADRIAQDLTAIGTPAFQKITQHFGQQVINQHGELNRLLLRKLIFSDSKHRLWLENLLHPLIKEKLQEEILLFKSPYCVIEIPLLIHREDYPYLDRILVIMADYDKQVERIITRDHCDKDSALAILVTQPSETSRQALADDLVMNNDSIEQLFSAIQECHVRYLHLAAKKL